MAQEAQEPPQRACECGKALPPAGVYNYSQCAACRVAAALEALQEDARLFVNESLGQPQNPNT